MVFYELQIGKEWKVKYTPIKEPEQNYPDVDEAGNPVERIKASYTGGGFKKANGEIVNTAFKLINGKARAKLEKTKTIATYKEVEANEVNNLMKEKYYYVDNEELKTYLKDNNKALKFGFTNGNGFSIYYGYMTIFGDALLMVLGKGYLTEQIAQIEDSKVAQKLIDELKGVQVENAKVEDMLQI